MALILPKGIVINSPGIEGSIERINTEPLDLADIARFWKVYTTTKRRLLDPTAERLENYWWRIWGSRKRELKGATVARLFAFISDGQSFVPLRGPANRDEGTPPLDRQTRHGPGASSTTAIHRPNQSRSSTTASSTTPKTPVIMPPPILKSSDSTKKNRGSSTSGPRPTARFVSPHESEDENSPVSPNSHVVVQPPSPISQESKTDKKKNMSGVKKKGGFIASSGKKRPVVVKRQSSQSSTDGPAKVMDGQALQSSSEKTPPTFVEQAQERSKQRAQSKFQENFSPASERSARKHHSSSKRSRTPDTKHLSPQKPTPGSRKEPKEASHVTLQETTSSTDPGPRSIEINRAPGQALVAEELDEPEVQRMLLADANARVEEKAQVVTQGSRPSAQSEGFQILHSSLRSRSDGTQNPIGMGAVRVIPHDNKSTASLAPTLADATGQLDMGNRSQQPSGSPKKLDKGKGRDTEEARRTEMFAKRPVQPVASASVPDSTGSLSRSKSQLTMLLERDRAKSIDNSSKDEKSKKT